MATTKPEVPAAPVLKSEDTLTEKEKAKSAGPVGKPVEPAKATILEIDASQPYPSKGD